MNSHPKGSARGVWATVTVVVLLLVGSALLFLLVHKVAIELVDQEELSSIDRLKAINDARSAQIALLGGIGIAAGLIFTAQSYRLSRENQVIDRFSKAVEQIGNKDSATTRAGGAYGLWLLAERSPEYWPVVVDILASLIREKATGTTVSADVQAAISILGRRPSLRPGQKGRPVDLHGVKMMKADLVQANLERVNFEGAVLQQSDLSDAVCVGATFRGATLDHAVMSGADLTNADFTDASLRQATLHQAVFDSTEMEGSHLSGARDLTQDQLASTTGTPSSLP